MELNNGLSDLFAKQGRFNRRCGFEPLPFRQFMKSLEEYTDEEINAMDSESIKNKLKYGIVIKKVVKEIMENSSNKEDGSLSLSAE